jgi:tellurite resistance protein TerC
MRTVLIVTGAELVERFEWLLIIFGLFLLYTAYKTWTQRDEHPDVEDSKILARVRRIIPTTEDYRGEHFFVRENGRLLATPLFVVLILVEFTDLIFAFDSIPAIFGVTTDPFIVLTSNIFAILGLRSLYFLLAGVADRLRYLKAGLALILGFVGVKLLVERVEFLPHPSPLASLGVVMGILAVTVVLSLRAGPPTSAKDVPSGVGNMFAKDKDKARPGPSGS